MGDEMEVQINNIKDSFLEEVQDINDLKSLDDIRVKYLGRSGKMTTVMRGMKDLSPEQRPVIGKLSNEVSTLINKHIDERREEIQEANLIKQLEEETIDISLNKDLIKLGHDHPLTQTQEILENLFMSYGFKVIDGPEIESVANNFDLLNSPKDHPSRDLSDTFYIEDDVLLRTHTSTVQIRSMKEYGAPLKMVSAGRTFRYYAVDATHSPMFHQMEGLVIDKDISMANLISSLDMFIKELFGEDIETRYRPHHFPFTEPSIEVDVTCFKCLGEGCDACGHTGWSMELLGAGMIHPKVLRNCGIDPEEYSGFAFGMGVDRITMVRFGISDIRLLFDNDNRFLNQF